MKTLSERLDELKARIQDPEFLEGKGLANEVNIRIFCYDPKEEAQVRNFMEKLVANKSLKCRPIEFNLFDVFLSICDEKGITGRIPQLEQKKGKGFALEQLKRVANPATFVDEMLKTQFQPGDVVIVAGVGEAFPFIRVHALLDAMQPHFSETPILVMYPGTFDGRNVKLFNLLTPNPYYRAFNVIEEGVAR